MIRKPKLMHAHHWKYWALTETSGIIQFVTKWWEQAKRKSTKQQRRIYFVSSEMTVTHNILSQPVSPDKEHLQSIIHPDSQRGHHSMRGLVLGIAFCLLPTISLIFFLPPKFAKFHVGTWKVKLWNDNCPTNQIKTMLYKIWHSTLKQVREKSSSFTSSESTHKSERQIQWFG